MSVFRGGVVLALAVLAGPTALLPAAPAEDAAAVAAGTQLWETVGVTLRSVRLRIDPVAGADPAECRSLGLDDLDVSLRGRRLPAGALIDLERRQTPALHALVIDTSPSMVGKLGFVREAATKYIEHLRPGLDRGLVATFDEDLILLQGATGDHAALLAAIDRARMGLATSLHDGLYFAIDELRTHVERPVVVLLTDGVDTGSLYERADVNALAESRPDLVVFSIGYQLPEIQAGSPGASSARRFLQNLARRTGGAFFDVPTASRLDRAYRRIRQMLASEATLTLNDPLPEALDGRIKVRSMLPACEVKVFRVENEPRADVPGDAAGRDVSAMRLPLVPGVAVRAHYGLPGSDSVPDACAVQAGLELPEAACFVESQPDRLLGCALDVAMDPGPLYSTLEVTRWEINSWIDLKIRPFEVPAPDLADLPDRPVGVLDRLAQQVQDLADAAPPTDSRKLPAPLHSRPFADLPGLVNGRTFLDARPTLARALFRQPGYGAWARARLAQDVGVERAALAERFRGLAPALSAAQLEQVVDASPAGRRLRQRVEEATDDDLRPYLAAWLGDVSAHDLFTGWEVDHAGRLLAGEPRTESFLQAWEALRRVFFVPSYARVLTLLHPVHDTIGGRIGFWRVILPRVSWIQPRVQGQRHPEFSDLPLDLVPDVPLGFHALHEQLIRGPELGRRLRAEGYRVTAIRYELLGKAWKRDPPRAFHAARVTVSLRPALEGAESGGLQLIADMRIDPDSGAASIERCEWAGNPAATLPACLATE